MQENGSTPGRWRKGGRPAAVGRAGQTHPTWPELQEHLIWKNCRWAFEGISNEFNEESARILKAKTNASRSKSGRQKHRVRRADGEGTGAEYLRIAMDAARMTTWDLDLKTDKIVWGGNNFQVFGLQSGKSPRTYAELELLIYPKDRKYARKQLAKARKGGEGA